MALTTQTSRRTLILQPTDAEASTNQFYSNKFEWRVDGTLTYPSPTVIDSLKHTDAAFNIYRVDVSVNVGGTSQYQIIINSYDTAGLNQIVHVNDYVTITGNKNRVSIAVAVGSVPQNRSLELVVLESAAAVAATDMTVTLIAEDFASIVPLRQGHRIVDPADTVMAQRPDLKFGGGFQVTDDALNNRTVVSSTSEIFNIEFTTASTGSSITGIIHHKLSGSANVSNVKLQVYNKNGISSGLLSLDVKTNTTPNDVGMTSILSSLATLDFSTAADYDTSSGVISTSSIAAGSYLRLDLTSVPAGWVGTVQILVY